MVDGSSLCMNSDRIFFHAPKHGIICLDTDNGKVLWENRTAELLGHLAKPRRSSGYGSSLSTRYYIRGDETYAYLCGPPLGNKVFVLSAKDGHIVSSLKEDDFPFPYELVKCNGEVFLINLFQKGIGRFDPKTGKLAETSFMGRSGCVRTTSSVDSILVRASEGTTSIDVKNNKEWHISPVRPPCSYGVIIANGF